MSDSDPKTDPNPTSEPAPAAPAPTPTIPGTGIPMSFSAPGAPDAAGPEFDPPDPGSPVPVAEQLKGNVVTVLKTVYDPEIPVDIYELGLIYAVEVDDAQEVSITMTLTSPMCPVAEILPPEVEAKVRAVTGVRDVDLEVVWDPPWSPDMMSEAAKLELNYF